MNNKTRTRNRNQVISRQEYNVPAARESSGSRELSAASKIANAHSIANLRNDLSAELTGNVISNTTTLMSMVKIADKICPEATPINHELVKGYAYKGMDYIRSWDR